MIRRIQLGGLIAVLLLAGLHEEGGADPARAPGGEEYFRSAARTRREGQRHHGAQRSRRAIARRALPSRTRGA